MPFFQLSFYLTEYVPSFYLTEWNIGHAPGVLCLKDGSLAHAHMNDSLIELFV